MLNADLEGDARLGRADDLVAIVGRVEGRRKTNSSLEILQTAAGDEANEMVLEEAPRMFLVVVGSSTRSGRGNSAPSVPSRSRKKPVLRPWMSRRISRYRHQGPKGRWPDRGDEALIRLFVLSV